MAHPTRFDPTDPVLIRFREICLALPSADEKISHGRPAFFTKKIFAMFGAVTKGDHGSNDYDQSLVFLADPEEVEALSQHKLAFVPAYWGPSGWLGYDLSGKVDWTEVAELVEDSFRQTATKKLISELDSAKP